MFKVGDRVRINSPNCTRFNGQITTVISELLSHNPVSGKPFVLTKTQRPDCGHLVDIPHPCRAGEHCCYLPSSLEPIDDTYDKAEWEDCIWNPLVKVEK